MKRSNVLSAPMLCAPALLVLAGSAAPARATVWPFPGNRVVTSSFGDDENNSIHGGLDIPSAAGSNVRAVQGFTISTIWVREPGGGTHTSSTAGDGVGDDVFQVMGTDAAGRTHLYAHLQNPAGGNITVGSAIAEGVNFARVRGGGVAFGGTFDHIHYNFSNNAPASAFGNWIDPLANIFNNTINSENISVNHITYRPLDNQFPIYGQKLTRVEPGRFIKGRVTMTSEIVDNMGDQARVGADVNDPRGTDMRLFNGISAVPNQVRYEVRKPDYLPRGTIAERTLETFNQTDSTHNGRRTIIFDETRNVTPDGSNTYNYNFNVTSTDGTRPNANNFWKTNAKKTGAGALGDGSSRANAVNNADGAFPDGVYDTRSGGVLADGTYAPQVYRVLVNNWNQTALPERNQGVMPPAGGASTETQPSSENTISPPPMMTFNTGDNVYVMGANYLDTASYVAYVFPFDVIWANGAPLTGYVSSQPVNADANGDISSQLAWGGASNGLYNLVIDYDNDGYFSWTLDGLGSFEVVPTPGAFALLGLGGLVAARRRRA